MHRIANRGFTDYNPFLGIVNYYQDLIGPFSFEKLANVQSKTMFGGMENSGCIFYSEKSVTGKTNSRVYWLKIAHQWFGDAVTENDWHHIWLRKGCSYTYRSYLCRHTDSGPEIGCHNGRYAEICYPVL